jgi:hypothetical protein
MGQHFSNIGVRTHLNPYGVIYNPVSIANLLSSTLNDEPIGHWQEHGDLWINTMYHGQFNHSTKEKAEQSVKDATSRTNTELVDADVLIVTLGTSYAFRDRETGEIVTNCHRLPADRFERVLLSIDKMYSALNQVLLSLRKKNPNLEIILTVSPVRHVRDSLVQNQLSKSQLICLAHQLADNLAEVNYFPSYEIMMDDLRDYRFYDEGLVQPNELGLTYIKEKFRSFAMSAEFVEYEVEALKLLKSLQHRVENDSAQTQSFVEKTKSRLGQFRKKYPFSEIEHHN